MNGGTSQRARIMDSVLTELDCQRLDRVESIGSLIKRFQQAEHWTPETDGLEHELADEIKVRVMSELGLTKAQADALGRAL